MRLQPLREGTALILTALFIGFCVFDEEPLIDPTDLNIVHVLLLLLSILSVLAELTTRARAGQLVLKDLGVYTAALSFWIHLDNYIKIILLVSSLHALTPLELELIDLVEIYHCTATWFCVEILPSAFLLALSYFCCIALGQLNSPWRAQLYLLLLLIASLAVMVCFLVWDILLSGLSSLDRWVEVGAFYTQAKTTLTYDQALGVRDQFEWHREQSRPFVFRFEDLYTFLFQLLMAWAAALALAVWSLITYDHFRGESRTLSSTQISFGQLWLDHLTLAYLFAAALLLVPALRLSLRSVAEYGFFF